MMDDNKRQFQIHLPGLLKVLAENLYSTPKVAIRELLQNAHDSCTRRIVEEKNSAFRPRVDVSIDSDEQTITIRDNGSGLTESEVIEYLSTIGRSYTRQLGETLSLLSPEMSEKLIGQFGLGFLSAFLIASEVTLTTRSMKPDSQTYQWHSQGDIHYDLKPVAEAEAVGTQVKLRIKPSVAYLLNASVLVDAIQHYADFLPIPVHVNGSSLPVNAIHPPWEALDPTIATEEYIARKFKMEHPLAVINLHDHKIDLGHDTMTVPLHGFLFIPPSSTVSIQEYGDLSIYIRRMFICENQRDLLPTWARFVRGVIDCPDLEPTASREELRREEMFLLVQQALEQQLSEGLHNIARTDTTRWKQIVRGHREIIMGWAVKNSSFFEQIASIVTFRTTRGPLSLPDYLKLTGNTVYYVTHEMDTKQEELLGEGFGMPVLDASRFGEARFLHKYADFHPQVQLLEMDAGSNRFMHPVPEEPFANLLAYYREQKIRAQVMAFKPEVLPAIMSYPKEAEFVRDANQALDAGEIPDAFAGMVGAYLSQMTVDQASLAGVLYLNANNPFVQALAKVEDAEQREPVLELIYQMARLLAGRLLDAQKITALFASSNQAFMRLIQ
jgi:molecular chaperone HtpG